MNKLTALLRSHLETNGLKPTDNLSVISFETKRKGYQAFEDTLVLECNGQNHTLTRGHHNQSLFVASKFVHGARHLADDHHEELILKQTYEGNLKTFITNNIKKFSEIL